MDEEDETKWKEMHRPEGMEAADLDVLYMLYSLCHQRMWAFCQNHMQLPFSVRPVRMQCRLSQSRPRFTLAFSKPMHIAT